MALSDGMEALARTVARSRARDETPRLMWGQVAAVGPPAQVVLDGDQSSESRPVSGSAVGPVAAGQRVLLARQGRRLWIVGGGQQWPTTVLTLAGGFAGVTGWHPAVQRSGGVVHLTGLATIPASASPPVTIATLPPWARPAQGLRFMSFAQGSKTSGLITVETQGGIVYDPTWLWDSTSPSGWITLEATWLAAD